jgi:hypothetical protein
MMEGKPRTMVRSQFRYRDLCLVRYWVAARVARPLTHIDKRLPAGFS